MSSSSKNWPVPSSFEEYLGQLNRRISGQERRQGPLLLSENLGPGLAARSKELRDWNDPEARFNGFFYSEPGASNTPDETKAWTGNVIARDNGSGMQQVWNTGNTEGTLYYIRTYTPISLADERVTFTEWKRFATESGLIDIEDLTPTVNFNIDTALAEAAEAFEFAVASNSTFRQDEEPVSDETYVLREGDIWFDTNDENRAYVWSGSAWVDTRDAGIAAAEAAALQGQQDAADALAAAVAAQEDATDALASASTANTAAVTAANTAAAASFATENRVVNGGAENDLAGWTLASGTITAVTERARTGLKSFKTTGSGDMAQGAIPVVAGDRWRMECWYQTTSVYSGPGGLRLQASTNGGSTWVDVGPTDFVANATTWTLSSTTYTVPAGTTHLRARIAFALSSGSAWVDDIRLENITLTGNVIQSSDLPNRGIKFNDAALIGYDSTGTPTFSLTSATGALALAGPVVTGGSVTGSTVQTQVDADRGVKITSAGITGYDTGGTPKFVLSATTGQITSLDVTAGTITGALVQTTATAGRGVKLTSAGLFGYNGSGAETFSINAATGSVILTGSATIGGSIDSAIVTGGTLQTSSFGSTGVKINSTGIVGYGGGVPKFVLNASTGQITSLDVTAGTITGATIKTNPGTGNTARVEMTSSGIYAYNGAGPTFALTTAGGSGTFAGSVTGTTVTADTQLRAGSGTSYVNVDNIGGLSFVTNSTTRGTIQGFSTPHLSLSATTGNLQLSAAGGFDVRSLGNFTVTGGLDTGPTTVSGKLTCSRLEVGLGTLFECITAGRANVTTNGSGTATINHGLGRTPISVQVMYEGANANYATLNSFNSTNFSYTMRNAAGDPILNASRTVNWVAFA